MNELPLVSVVIDTYNSSSFVEETLDSAYRQTYPNIELIITDDGSRDDTIDVVKKWIEHFGNRFVRCELIESSINTGIPANCNRGIKACRGEWIRLIAGDDLLIEDSIEKQIQFVKPGVEIFVGDTVNFTQIGSNKQFHNNIQIYDRAPWFFEKDAQYQYKFLLYHYNFGLGISFFAKKTIYETVSMYDERYPLEEDTLFQLNITKAGIKYYHLEQPVMRYRMHDSVSRSKQDTLLNKRYEDTKKAVRKNHIYPEIPWYDVVYWESELIDSLIYFLSFKVFNNKRTVFSFWVLWLMRKCRLLDYRNMIIDGIEKKFWIRRNKNRQ